MGYTRNPDYPQSHRPVVTVQFLVCLGLWRIFKALQELCPACSQCKPLALSRIYLGALGSPVPSLGILDPLCKHSNAWPLKWKSFGLRGWQRTEISLLWRSGELRDAHLHGWNCSRPAWVELDDPKARPSPSHGCNLLHAGPAQGWIPGLILGLCLRLECSRGASGLCWSCPIPAGRALTTNPR